MPGSGCLTLLRQQRDQLIVWAGDDVGGDHFSQRSDGLFASCDGRGNSCDMAADNDRHVGSQGGYARERSFSR